MSADPATTSTQLADTAALLPQLRAQQARVLGILDGLDEQALRRAVLPSGWSCLGMVQHLTGMTTFWFCQVMNDRHPAAPLDDDFAVAENRSAAEVLHAYRREVAEATALVERMPAQTPPAWWPEGAFGDWRLATLHEVLMHVIVEQSTHAGHLDVVRELLDGKIWDYA